MKKSLFIFAVFLIIGFTVSAATIQDLVLNGTVDADIGIVLNDDQVVFDLNDPVTDEPAGSLDYTANAAFTISATSANGFKFVSTGSGSDSREYTLKLGATVVSSTNNYNGTAGTGNLNIYVSYNVPSFIAQDDYSDTVTFEITTP